MSCYTRPRVPGACVFFTVNLAVRGSRLLVDEIDLLRGAVGLTRKTRPFHVDAWMVLPDHMHCIWTLPEGDADYSTRWGAIKARFTRSLREDGYDVGRPGFSPATGFPGVTPGRNANRRPGFSPAVELPVVSSGRYAGLKPGLRVNKRECAVWQRRFWEHHVRDAAEYDALMRYCRENPVKHGFVERAEDWPYSSVHGRVRNA
ncbi:transposase [Pseudohalocynthiibacter aestuariivivens]|nr:transposase [Pseudohalocynthiibacter aestuariivivens]QIE45561.1 transposase [Pseudohalocynthiibacter aestuariivivens]